MHIKSCENQNTIEVVLLKHLLFEGYTQNENIVHGKKIRRINKMELQRERFDCFSIHVLVFDRFKRRGNDASGLLGRFFDGEFFGDDEQWRNQGGCQGGAEPPTDLLSPPTNLLSHHKIKLVSVTGSLNLLIWSGVSWFFCFSPGRKSPDFRS